MVWPQNNPLRRAVALNIQPHPPPPTPHQTHLHVDTIYQYKTPNKKHVTMNMYLQIRTVGLRKLFLKGSLSRRLWSFRSFWGIRKKFLFEGEEEKNRLFLRGGTVSALLISWWAGGSVTTNRATDIRGRSYIMSRGGGGGGFQKSVVYQNFTPQIITYENCTPLPILGNNYF